MNDAKLKALLDAIGPESDEAELEDPRWEALATGALDEAEAADLIADAEASPELALFTPLDASFTRRTAIRLVGIGESERVFDAAAASAATPAAHVSPGLLTRLRGWLLRPAWIVPGLAAAAALIVLGQPAVEPLPAYAGATVLGGVQAQRGAPDASVTFVRGQQLTLVARPDVAAETQVQAAMYLVDGEQLRPVAARVEVSAGGAVRAVATVGEQLPGEVGSFTVALVLRAGEVPLDAPEAEAVRAQRAAGVYLEQEVMVVAPDAR